MNINQLKLELQDTYKKDVKITTYFEAVNDENVKNKACLDENLLKMYGTLSFLEKNYSEYN